MFASALSSQDPQERIGDNALLHACTRQAVRVLACLTPKLLASSRRRREGSAVCEADNLVGICDAGARSHGIGPFRLRLPASTLGGGPSTRDGVELRLFKARHVRGKEDEADALDREAASLEGDPRESTPPRRQRSRSSCRQRTANQSHAIQLQGPPSGRAGLAAACPDGKT